MNARVAVKPELQSLIEAVCDGVADNVQLRNLRSFLLTDEAARILYVDLLNLDAELNWLVGSQHAGDAVLKDFVAAKQEPSASPAPTFPATLSQNTLGYFSSGWPVAYLIATAILGVGLTIAALTRVSRYDEVVNVSPPAAGRHQSEAQQKAKSVGRITGMVDCQWVDESTAAFHGAHVPLGRKYAIRSGLMEITHDTGAKVILQGPVTYEVESAGGGYLSLGKLTAKLEKWSAVSGQGSENAKCKMQNANCKLPDIHHSSFITHHSSSSPQSVIPNPSSLSPLPSPLFTIKTPTATITDLGTEFGVEVSKEGQTTSYVFRGSVEVHLAANDGRDGQTIRLTEDESVRVGKQRNSNGFTVQRGVADRTVFVRPEQLHRLAEELRLTPLRRWQAYSRQLRKDPALVAYYTCESPGDDLTTLTNVAATGSAFDARIEGPEWTAGRLPGKSALWFRGPGSGDRVVLPDQNRFNFSGAFSLAVWCRMQGTMHVFPAMVTESNSAWRLQLGQLEDRNNPMFGTGEVGRSGYHSLRGRTSHIDNCWHMVFVVYEPSEKGDSKRLYVDGRLESESHDVPRSLPANNQPVRLGSNSSAHTMELQGWIDEVAIFSRALSAEEIGAMKNEAIALESRVRATGSARGPDSSHLELERVNEK